jgi:hypothetical protein
MEQTQQNNSELLDAQQVAARAAIINKEAV